MAASQGQPEGQPELELAWSVIPNVGDVPKVRGGHSAVAVESQVIVFGGQSYVGDGKFEYFNDVHVFIADEGRWHKVTCGGELPAPRYGHSAELVGSRMFLFGGMGENGPLRDIQFLDLIEWAWVTVSSTSVGPSPRLNHASLLVGRKIVVHGGWDGVRRCFNDLWVFDTDSFTWLNPRTAGLAPVPRYGHSLQLQDGRIMLYGGMVCMDNEVPKYLHDLRQLDAETMVWSKPRIDGDVMPSARFGHSLSQLPIEPGKLILFGGWGLGGVQCRQENKRRGAESVMVYDAETSSWTTPAMPSRPLPHKYGHTATAIEGSLFVFGGWTGKQATNQLMHVVIRPCRL